MTTHATAEGTKSYAERFAAGNAAGHFRTVSLPGSVLSVSSIGMGTYLGQPDGGTAGGGDTDMAVAPSLNPGGFYKVYMSSLTLASVTLATMPSAV